MHCLELFWARTLHQGKGVESLLWASNLNLPEKFQDTSSFVDEARAIYTANCLL